MRTRLSFLKWVVNLSKWVSLIRSSKRVCAEMVGFFHRFWLKRKKGENDEIVVVAWKILYLKVDNGFMSLMCCRFRRERFVIERDENERKID